MSAAELKLFMVIVGCRPGRRLTEQHDVFFGIARQLKDLIPHIKASWPEAKGKLHIDSWRMVTRVDNYAVRITDRQEQAGDEKGPQLFFINLGGYKPNDLEEYHYKHLAVAASSAEAIRQAKQTAFYRHTGISSKGGNSHIDDKYGLDVDDVFKLEDALDNIFKQFYTIELLPAAEQAEDPLHIGYLPLNKLAES